MRRSAAHPLPEGDAIVWSRTTAVVAMLVLLVGCATPGPMRTFTTEAEVLAAYGEPARRWPNDDGSTTLEYSTQPNGHVTMMITVDQGGIVLHQQDALAPENLARVKRGMTQEEVSRLLGQHRSEQTFSSSGEQVWDWNVQNDYYSTAALATLFNVHFIEGKVVRTSRSYVYPNDGAMFGHWYGPGFGPPHPFARPFPPRSRWPHRHWPRYRLHDPWYFW